MNAPNNDTDSQQPSTKHTLIPAYRLVNDGPSLFSPRTSELTLIDLESIVEATIRGDHIELTTTVNDQRVILDNTSTVSSVSDEITRHKDFIRERNIWGQTVLRNTKRPLKPGHFTPFVQFVRRLLPANKK